MDTYIALTLGLYPPMRDKGNVLAFQTFNHRVAQREQRGFNCIAQQSPKTETPHDIWQRNNAISL